MTEAGAQPAATSDPAVWVEQHGDALYRYALLRVREPDLAEELVQECLVAALGARDSFAGQAAERTWLIGILKRKVVDHIRKRTRERAAFESNPAADTDHSPAPYFKKSGKWNLGPKRWGSNPGDALETREFWDVFWECMNGLPPAMGEAFLLCEMDQAKNAEICEILDLTATNLWTRLHRARLALRACLESNWFTSRKRKESKGNA